MGHWRARLFAGLRRDVALASVCGALSACASSATSEVKVRAGPPPVELGERALASGDFAMAIGVLSTIPPSDPAHGYAAELLQTARSEVSTLVDAWLEEIAGLTRLHRFEAARTRADYLLEELPLSSDKERAVRDALRQIGIAQEAAVANLEELDRQAAEEMLQGRWRRAATSLARAMAIAADVDTAEALARQQLLNTAELRLEAAPSLRASEEPGKPPKARKRVVQKSANKAKGPKTGKGGPEGNGTAEPAQSNGSSEQTPAEDEEVAAERSRVAELLAMAADFRRRNAWFNAITTYLRAVSIEPTNATAKRALAELEPQRRALIQGHLETAQEHFLRQDLARAVPHYRRVLLLEPDNEQALGGLRMHENLERIRRERQGSGQ